MGELDAEARVGGDVDVWWEGGGHGEARAEGFERDVEAISSSRKDSGVRTIERLLCSRSRKAQRVYT